MVDAIWNKSAPKGNRLSVVIGGPRGGGGLLDIGGQHFTVAPDGALMEVRGPDPDLVCTREFAPNETQLIVVNAIYQSLGVVCPTPEDAIALLTYALTDYIQRIAKKDKLPEAVETLIACIRFNTGIE